MTMVVIVIKQIEMMIDNDDHI